MMLNATESSVVVAKVGNGTQMVIPNVPVNFTIESKVGNGSQVVIPNVPVNMTIEKVTVELPKNISGNITEGTSNCVI